MKGTGIFKVQVDGKEVGLRFGMLASSITEEYSKKTIYQIFKEIASGQITAMLQYFYGGVMAFNHYEKNKKEVTLADVATLIEQNGDECARIYAESIKFWKPEEEKETKGESTAA